MYNESLEIKPIGYIHSNMILKFDAPHQPDRNKENQSYIEIFPSSNFKHGLDSLNTFSHIWIIWWFHKNKTWKPKVRPPRGPEIKRGVFSTRSPHRPNPIGITAVELIKIEENKIYIGSNDLIDGTPILDIKPYLPRVDIFDSANSGWLEELDFLEDKFKIEFSELANKQIKWFEEHNINFIDRAKELLVKDPSPHKTRRIKQVSENKFKMGCGGWRIVFCLNNEIVFIENFESGYKMSTLEKYGSDELIQKDAHIDFLKTW